MKNKVLRATITAIITAGLAANASAEMNMGKAPKDTEKCYGVAKAGMNDCAYANQACAGASSIDGEKDAWINLPVGTCDKLVGGSTKSPKK